jgi:acetyl esterase/lipase
MRPRHLLICVLLLTCWAQRLSAAEPTSQPATRPTAGNVLYKTGALSDYEQERCRLDLYRPANKTGFATVVWWHGGGLTAGSRFGVPWVFLDHGIAVVSAEYRLSPKATYPAYVEDAAAALAWTIQHIAEYGGDPKRVFVAGHSAGGYLAALVTYDPKYLKPYGLRPDDVAGDILVAPQVFTHYTVRQERGIENPITTPMIDAAAPCYYVRKDAPPTLIILGDNDFPVRLEENQYFVAMLRHLKAPDVDLQVVKDRTHTTIFTKMSEPDDPVGKLSLDFVGKHAGSR